MKLTGQILKEAREKRQITVSEVAHATKISVRVIEAIEHGDEDHLPPKTFLRGFVQSYAQFLKLDADQILKTFHEEMGKTNFQPPIEKEETAPRVDLSSLNPSLRLKIAGSIIGSILIILLIILIKRTIDKYERESQIGELPRTAQDSALSPVDPSKSAAAVQEAETQSTSDTLTTEKPTSSGPPQAAAKKPSSPTEPQTSSNERDTKLETSPTTTAEPPKPREASLRHQEVILEALDNVEISFKVDDGAWKGIQLQPEQLLTIKGERSLRLRLSDGGAINLIHNGQDRGVPGDLGKPLSLKYP